MYHPPDEPDHSSARRWLFVVAASLALAVLVVLPWVGFQRLSAANRQTHDLTLVLAATNYASSSITGAISGPVRSFELSGRETDYQQMIEATEMSEDALYWLEDAYQAAERVGLADEVDAYLESSYEFLLQLEIRANAVRKGADPEKAPNAGAYFAARRAHLRDQDYLNARIVELGGELDEERTRAMRTAWVLLLASVFVAVGCFVLIAVTETKRNRRQMLVAETRVAVAERSAQQRAEMVNLASHELRNPLAVMSLAAQMLQGTAASGGDPLLEQAANDAYAAARRAEALVAELLDLSRLDANKLKLVIHPVPLDLVLGEAVSLTVHHLGERPVAVTGATETAVMADPGRLGIILRNLVDNAFKYSPPGSEVAINVTRANSTLEVQVRDQGPGIPIADRERVFERFERLSATQHVGGIGIGLHLSRELARRMGGELSVAPSNSGTCMRLVLPQASRLPEAA